VAVGDAKLAPRRTCGILAHSGVEFAPWESNRPFVAGTASEKVAIDTIGKCEPKVVAALGHGKVDIGEFAANCSDHAVAMTAVGVLDYIDVLRQTAGSTILNDDPLRKRAGAPVRLELNGAVNHVGWPAKPADAQARREQLRECSKTYHAVYAIERFKGRTKRTLRYGLSSTIHRPYFSAACSNCWRLGRDIVTPVGLWKSGTS
jgi:hypothetical protein